MKTKRVSSDAYLLARDTGGRTWSIFRNCGDYSAIIATLECSQETAQKIVDALRFSAATTIRGKARKRRQVIPRRSVPSWLKSRQSNRA